VPTGVRHPIAISGESTPRHFSLPKSSWENPPIEASFQPVLPAKKASLFQPTDPLSPYRHHRSDGCLTPNFSHRPEDLSNLPESMESCRFKIRGFAGSSDRFSFRMSSSVSSFFLMKPNQSGGPPDLIRIPSGNRQTEGGSMIHWVSGLSDFQTGMFYRFSHRYWQEACLLSPSSHSWSPDGLSQ
jgi:hypothetical protein